jgi:hypothetical protein
VAGWCPGCRRRGHLGEQRAPEEQLEQALDHRQADTVI